MRETFSDAIVQLAQANKKVLLNDLESETIAWAERLAKRSPQSLSNTKTKHSSSDPCARNFANSSRETTSIEFD